MAEAHRGRPPVGQLILTVTRACNYRCSYCPTAKDGWPALSPEDAAQAVDLFAERYGGGDIKLFGGEPLLEPEVVTAAIDRAVAEPLIRRVYLSTNGLGLDEAWLERVRTTPKLVLTLSLDGAPEDHRRFRRAQPGVADSYDRVLTLRPLPLQTPFPAPTRRPQNYALGTLFLNAYPLQTPRLDTLENGLPPRMLTS